MLAHDSPSGLAKDITDKENMQRKPSLPSAVARQTILRLVRNGHGYLFVITQLWK
jgi:hypothetical protein